MKLIITATLLSFCRSKFAQAPLLLTFEQFFWVFYNWRQLFIFFLSSNLVKLDPDLDPDPGLGLSIFDFGHIFEYYIILYSTFVQALPYLPPDRVKEGFQANLRYVDKHIDVSICFGF